MSRILQIETMLQQQPNDSFLLHALALEYIKINDDNKALELFTSLLASNEKYYGSYYHLGKLYERNSNEAAAIATYEKGMEITKTLKEMHAYGELRGALEELTM